MNRWLLTCALFASFCHSASADILNAGSKLRITFRVDVASPTPDVLLMHMGIVNVISPYTIRSATLYDGVTALGTYSSSLFGNHAGLLSLSPGASFKDPSSLWTFDQGLAVPFGTIQNGTIHGVIEFTLLTGSMDIPLNQINLTLQQANGPSGGFVSSPAPTVESVCIETGDFLNFCPGDGTGTACPCGNSALLGSDTGCLSSLGVGARLVVCGDANVVADTLQLRGSQMPNSSALYFTGTTQLGGGNGLPFGDGLRCVGGTIIRLGIKVNVGSGMSQYPGPGDPPISGAGSLSPGDVRTYQIWYRNAAGFCTPATFNLSNAVQVQWF